MTSAVRLLRESESWRGLRARIDSLGSTKQKGDCFELLVKFYLTLEPKYATKLKSVWLLSEVPPNIRRKLNLPDTDEGIDLVARTNDGDFWAIQAKYRSKQEQSLTRRELATFTDLSFSICNGIDLALVCTTTDRFSRKLKYHGERLTFCAGEVWRKLDSEFFERLHQLIDEKLAQPKPYTPYPHQTRAIDNAAKHYLDNEEARGKMIMPCGTGKSLTAFWIAQNLQSKRILIAVPSLALVRQTLEVWARECLAHGIEVHWIAVCSDPSVGDPKNDDVAVLTHDLGVDIQTDAARIGRWLSKPSEHKVVFTTYQSGRTIAEAAKSADFEFDLAILDEAHRTVGKQSSLFSHLLFDDNLKASKRLAMTATERRYSGRSDKIVGMDSIDLYGSTFELLSFNAALEANPPILSDYQIITVFITREEVDELIQRNLFVQPDRGKWNNEIEAQMLSALVCLRKAMLKYPISHAISFHSSIAKASAFSKNQDVFTRSFKEYGELDCYHVNGRTKTSIRARRMKEFEASDRALVSNARCLSEGVDVPDIDCVLFADPKRSAVDIVQASGRAMRPKKDESVAYIVVPVEIGNLADEVEVQESVFGSVLTILRALASNDERIIEYFRSVAAGKLWRGGSIPFEVVVPESVKIDAEAFIHSVQLSCWSKLGKLEWRPFEDAREFVRSLGLSNATEWLLYCQGLMPNKRSRPPDIPSSPNQVYAGKGWTDYQDWLGSYSARATSFRRYSDASQFARRLGLKSQSEWFEFTAGRLKLDVEKPGDIPANPYEAYKGQGWVSWHDFLGIRPNFVRDVDKRPFADAREFARSLNLGTRREWLDFCHGKRPDLPPKPDDMPIRPEAAYANSGWKTYGDWLGTAKVRTRDRVYLPFEKGRDFARGLGLKSGKQWNDYVAGRVSGLPPLPADIPRNPQSTYRGKGWDGIPDWLGYEGRKHKRNAISNRWRHYAEARAFVNSLGLTSIPEWNRYCKGDIPDKLRKPDDIPADPRKTYTGRGWTNWFDWLGKQRRTYRTFLDARAFARSLGLKSAVEWRTFYQGKYPHLGECPKDIPSGPHHIYQDSGWKSWPDWLGTEVKWRPFEEAREFVHSLGLKTSVQWRAYRKGLIPNKPPRPADIPANPDQKYKDNGWIDWPDWLGTKQIKKQ